MKLVGKYGRLSSIPFANFSLPLHFGIFHILYQNFRSIPFHTMPWFQFNGLGFNLCIFLYCLFPCFLNGEIIAITGKYICTLANIVYVISCKSCPSSVCIGETSQTLQNHINGSKVTQQIKDHKNRLLNTSTSQNKIQREIAEQKVINELDCVEFQLDREASFLSQYSPICLVICFLIVFFLLEPAQSFLSYSFEILKRLRFNVFCLLCFLLGSFIIFCYSHGTFNIPVLVLLDLGCVYEHALLFATA